MVLPFKAIPCLMLKHRSRSTAGTTERPYLAPAWLIALLATIVAVALFLLYPRTDLERRLAATPDTALSAAYLQNLLRSDPDNPRLRLLLAQRQLEMGNTADAQFTLQPALKADDENVRHQARWVLWRLTERDYLQLPEDAGNERQKLLGMLIHQLYELAELPLAREQRMELASKAYRFNQPVLGARLFKEVANDLHGTPEETTQLYEQAAAKSLATGDYDGAAELHLLASKSSTDPLRSRRNFHDALRTLQSGNKPLLALKTGEREIGTLVNDTETQLLMTRLARAAGRPDVAERYVRLLLKYVSPGRPGTTDERGSWFGTSFAALSPARMRSGPGIPFDDSVFTLGYDVFLENRKLEDAWLVAASAARHVPADMAWQRRLATASEWTVRPRMALDSWLKLASATQDEEAWANVLRLAPGLFDDRALIAAIRHQITRRPGNIKLLRELVAAHERLGEPELAIAYMQTMSSAKPRQPEILEMLAELAERAGQTDLALHSWEKLFALPDQLTPARALRVAVMLLIRGRYQESLSWLERAQDKAGTASPEEIEYWRLTGQLAELRQRDNQAVKAFRHLLETDQALPADYDALIRLLVPSMPIEAAALSVDAWHEFDETRHLLQAMTLYALHNRWPEIGRLLRQLDPAPDAPRRALKTVRMQPEFLRLAGAYQQNTGNIELARRSFEAGLRVAPDSADMQQALIWLLIDSNDAPALRKLLGKHERHWSVNPALHDTLASAYQALSLPRIALVRYLTPRLDNHRHDLLWMMNYADALDQNQQSNLAWRLRRQLLSREWNAAEKNSAAASAREYWLSEPGLELFRRIARARLILTQYPGDNALITLRQLLRLDRSHSGSFSNGVAETAIGWLQDHAEYHAERAILWHQYAKNGSQRTNRPLWAEITVALSERDRQATGQLLERFDERLPRYDRVNAARAVDDLRLAQTAAFDAQTDQIADDPTHLQLTETLLAFSDHAGFAIGRNKLGSIDEALVTTRYHLAINPRLAIDFDWGRLGRKTNQPDVIKNVPNEKFLAAMLSWRHTDGETQFTLQRRDSLTSYTPMQIEHEQRIDDRLSLRIGLGKNLKTTESIPLRVAGMKDRQSVSLRYRPTRMDQITLEHWRENYRLQTGPEIGEGRHSTLTFAHTYRQEARDLEFSAFWSKHDFSRRNISGAFLTGAPELSRLLPSGFVPGPEYFLPESFNLYGIRVATDMRHEREYTRATRPFASLSRTWHSTLGPGYDIRFGIAGSVLGGDHLALSWGKGKSGQETNAPVSDWQLTYRIHY